MDADRFRERMSLEPVVRSALDLSKELRRELDRDPALSAALEERIRIDRALDELPALDSSDASIARVIAAVRADDASRRASRRLRPAWIVAAAALLALGIGLARMRPQPTGPVDDELLAHMDLLLDWDVIDAHADALDAVAVADLAAAMAEFDGANSTGGAQSEIPR